jgi:preprotein translocase subunit SecE
MTPVLVSMFLFDWPNRRFTIHRIIAVLLFLGLSLLPLLGITEWNIYTLFLITIGLMLFIIGILDHLLLVHTLKPVPEEDDGTDF